MKKLFRRPMPAWPKMVLAVLLLFLILTAAFHMFDRPMPTPVLAGYFVEQEDLWGKTETVSQGDADYPPPPEGWEGSSVVGGPDETAWVLRRCGDRYALTLPERRGLLWTVSRWGNFYSFSLTEEDPVYYYSIPTFQYLSPPNDAPSKNCFLVLAAALPTVTRLEGEIGWVPLGAEEDASLARHGAPLVFTNVGTNMWKSIAIADSARYMAGSGSLAIRVRGYDAAGALVYNSEDS